MADRTYTRDEVEDILRTALQRTEEVEGLTHDELRDVANEVGIPLDDLDAAIAVLERERAIQGRADQIIDARKARFYRMAGNAAIVGTFLGAIDYMTGPGWWVQYAGAVAGLVLAFQGRSAFLSSRARVEAQARKKLEREWRKEAWRKREKEIPKAVEAGAAALIEAAARKIAERLDGSSSRPRVRVDARPVSPRSKEAAVEAELELERLRERARRR